MRRSLAGTVLALTLLAACSSSGHAGSPATTARPNASSPAPTAGTGSFKGTNSGDFCAQAAPIVKDQTLQQALSGSADPQALKAGFARIVSAFDTLAKAAPQEIKADVETVRTSYRQADALFAKYGYDRQKLLAAAKQDPSLLSSAGIGTDAFQSSEETLGNYLTQVCGLTPPTS